MKKIFTAILSLVFLAVSTFPVSCVSLAGGTQQKIQYYETQIDDYEYTISSNNIILQKYIGTEKNIFVPAKLTDSNSNTYSVKFNNTVFKGNQNIENAYIQQGISINPSNNIFSESFKNCTSLKTVFGFVPKGAVHAQSLFEGCTNLTDYFDLSSIKGSCYRLFYKCASLEVIDTLPHGGNNTQFSQFTVGCTNLKAISCSIPETACYFADSFNCPNLSGEILFDSVNFDHSKDSSAGSRENYCSMFKSYYKKGITLKAEKGTSLYNTLVDCASNNSTITVKSTSGEEIKNYIYCIGDSLTAGMGDSNTTYPTELNSLLGYNIACRNYSDGGMKISEMSNRVGSSRVKITQDFTIPSNTEPVLIQTNNYFDSKYLYKESSSTPTKIGEVTIDGIKGSLTWSSNDKAYLFERSTAGDEHNVSADTEIITNLSQKINDCDTVLLFVGANDILSSYNSQSSINHIIEKTNEIINYLPTDKYIVAYYGGYYNPDAEQTADLDKAMAYNFDNSKLINIRAALCENGLEYNSLTPTEEDENFINIGKIPSSLMSSDNIHLNTYGYKAVANEFYKKIVENKYDTVCEKNDFSNHNYDEGTITVEPTCNNYGEITYRCKNNPNHIYKTQIEKTNHNYVTTVVNPTCNNKGYSIHKCSTCGYYFIDYITEKTEHNLITKLTKANLSKNGSVVISCIACGEVKSKSTIYYPKTTTLSTTSYIYDGKVKKPVVKVVGSNGKTISSSNYTVTYASGRKNVGKYAVKITFKGNYSGTKTLYFTIKPKATSISSLSAGSKKFTVKWKKQSTQVTGYQIQYSTSSKFSSPKTVTVSSYKTTSKTISKLKGKKKYYVRVRTYKTVGSTKYYSSWSGAKFVTTVK